MKMEMPVAAGWSRACRVEDIPVLGARVVKSAFGNIAAPTGGYIWDYATRAHVSVRSYGEFGNNSALPNRRTGRQTSHPPGIGL